MATNGSGWIEILSANDDQALWAKLFRVVSRHSAVRMLYGPDGMSGVGMRDIYDDLTQELFLTLHRKGRWRSYVDAGYTDDQVEQELYRIELSNLVSRMQRERYPESYRLARRVSDLLQTRSHFKQFGRSVSAGRGTASRDGCSKMALKVYGLVGWPLDKEIAPSTGLVERTKDVPFRQRDTRRSGRGSGSQIIVSNKELNQLIFDIFLAIDTPTDVRTIRSLVLSKLAVQDYRFVSIDHASIQCDDDQAARKHDLADIRPTPLEMLLQKEAVGLVDAVVEEILVEMKCAVRNREARFRKQVEVAWHCYFNPSSPSQSSIAVIMGISDSLVSHYRRIFDGVIETLVLGIPDLILLNSALERRIGDMMLGYTAIGGKTNQRTPGTARRPLGNPGNCRETQRQKMLELGNR